MADHYIQDIIDNIKQVALAPSTLQTLMDFERVLDDNQLYAFQHWKFAELVQGPEISKYRIKCTFMLPLTKMPDPSGAERLLPYGALISYRKSWLSFPTKIKSEDDYRSGIKKAKMAKTRVWLIEIDLPKHLIKDIKKGSEEIMASDIDMEDIDDAYAEGLANTDNVSSDEDVSNE